MDNQNGKARKARFLRSAMILDAAPEVLRAHTIADVIRAMADAGALDDFSTEQRNDVAEALGVPALWIGAAWSEGHDTPIVSLDLIEAYRDWHRALAPKVEE